VETFMVTVGPDHAAREVRQVLSDDYVFRIHPGMSREEVRRLLGRPGETMSFERRDEEVWSWRYQDAAARYMILHVVFDRSAGTVRTSFRIDETTSDGRNDGH
jgi:SmpA/OmlA family protein